MRRMRIDHDSQRILLQVRQLRRYQRLQLTSRLAAVCERGRPGEPPTPGRHFSFYGTDFFTSSASSSVSLSVCWLVQCGRGSSSRLRAERRSGAPDAEAHGVQRVARHSRRASGRNCRSCNTRLAGRKASSGRGAGEAARVVPGSFGAGAAGEQPDVPGSGGYSAGETPDGHRRTRTAAEGFADARSIRRCRNWKRRACPRTRC